jgi:hypothetical protein
MGEIGSDKVTDTDSSPLDFLSLGEPTEAPPSAESPVQAPGTPETPPAAVTPEPGSDVPPAPPLTPPAAPEAPQSNGHVPLAAVLDEREKRQRAERELAELKAKQNPPPAPPSITSDPEGYARSVDARIAQTQHETKLQLSGQYAEQHFGKETIQAAMEWGGSITDPSMHQRFNASADPYGFLVAEYRKAQSLEKLGDKPPEDWALEYAKAQGWAPPAGAEQQPADGIPSPAAQPAPVAPKAPTRSLASAPSAGNPSTPAPIADNDIVGGLWAKE